MGFLEKLKHRYMGVSENGGTPKSSHLIGISIINQPFWGTPIFGNSHMGTWRNYVKKHTVDGQNPASFGGV